MKEYDACEVAYKNGFNAGYVKGVCDKVEGVLKGVIRWHSKVPDHDLRHCFVVVQDDTGKNTVFIGSYDAKIKCFSAQGYGVVSRGDFVMWGEFRTSVFSADIDDLK